MGLRMKAFPQEGAIWNNLTIPFALKELCCPLGDLRQWLVRPYIEYKYGTQQDMINLTKKHSTMSVGGGGQYTMAKL